MITANMTSAQYNTFLAGLKSSKEIFNLNLVDGFNGTFSTSAADFKFVYLPTAGASNLGEIVYEVVTITGLYIFTSSADTINHINSAVAGVGY